MNTQTSYFKKALVVLMAVMMVFTMMPSMAWATDATETSSNESSEGNIASGNCGAESNTGGVASVTWKLSKDGTLTISGTGAMDLYWLVPWGTDDRPWKDNVTKIKNLVVENGVTSIGDYAFYSCPTLENVKLPESLTKIGPGAFENCTSLKKMTLQYVVTEDNMPKDDKNGCIYGCTAIETIQIGNEGSTVKCEDGIYYSKDGKELIFCLKSKKGEVTISDSVESLRANWRTGYAFEKCSMLESLVLPEKVVKAEANVWDACTNLRYIEFKGVESVENWAFSNCTALDQLVLPACLTSYAETSVTPKLICFRGSEEQWEAAATEKVRTKLEDKGTVVVYNYDDQAGVSATITAQPEPSVNIGLGQTKYLSVAVNEEEGTQYYYRWFKKTANEAKKVSNLSEDARYKVDSSTKGTTNYYCEVVTVKDGKTAVTQSNEAAVTVGDLTTGFSGSGTQADPYQLATAENMSELAGLVNSGISFSGKYFKLTADITLPDNNWTPIGCKINPNIASIEAGENLYPFSGTIDGAKEGADGECWTLTVPQNGLPLLGYVKGATVKNLNLAGERINGYGLVNNFEGVGLSGTAITIENVTIKAGTKIVKSGLLGANMNENPYAGVSAAFVASIKNCTIEPGAVIGCDGDQNMIGGFAGRMQGTIENCKNYGTVKGKNVVGGIIGTRDNALKICTVKNCGFYGSVIGEENVGGIVGSGYMTNNVQTASAPNGQRINILGNTVGEGATVNGNKNVGGILGSDLHVAQVWDNVIYSFAGNSFSGKISGKTNVGGIIGFYDSLNKYDNIAGNFYKTDCGATKGIGAVKYVDTNVKKPTQASGTTYINTEFGVRDCPTVEGCQWKAGHNRTDDPLGADASRLAGAVETVPTEAICYELAVKGTVKEHYVGNELDLSGLTFTAKWTGGKADTHPTFGTGADNVKATGYDKNSHSIQTVILSYGYAQTTIQVAVKKQAATTEPGKTETLHVSFTLLGDSKHQEANQDGGPHGLALNKLNTWLSAKSYEVPLNSTVWDLMQQIDGDNSNVQFNAKGTQYGIYVYSVTYNGTELGEFDNGKNSGWMYTVNGTHPEVGVASKFLNNGDTVVFHYTDDYTKEEGSEKWNTPAGGAAGEEVKDVTTSGSAGSATTKAPTDVKISEKTNADGTKETVAEVKVATEHQGEILKQAAEKKSTEIILEVSAANTKGAESVQLSLDVTFVKNVADKTDADLTVNTENGKVTLDQETIKTVLAETKGATITLEVSKVAKPTEVQKKAAGANGHLLKLTIKSGDKVISDFNKGKVKVVAEIVSKLLNKKVAAIHIADDGKIEQLAGKVLTIGGKKYYEFTTPHFSTFALVDADELGLDVAEEPTVDAKALTAKLTPIARSAKTAKKNVKVTVSLDKQDKAIIEELKDAGYTVKYRFYRSTKKAAGYKAAVTKKTAAYTNTSGKKGTKYYYKVQVRVYDANGKLAAKTALKQCKYASRTWTK